MDALLTVTEAAALYGCTRPNMWHLMNTGRLPYTMYGNMALIKRKDLTVLLKRRAARRTHVSWIEPVRRAVA